MPEITVRLVSSLLAPLLCYPAFKLFRRLYRYFTSPLRNLPGPKSPSFFYGHFNEMKDDPLLTAKWVQQFGPIFHFRTLFNAGQLYTSDPKALNHVLYSTDVYQKSEAVRQNALRFFGNTIISAELDEHKRQRKIMNPVFAVPQLRELNWIFLEKAAQLRDIWAGMVVQENDAARIDVYDWVRKMALDVIGQAGLNYKFNALESGGKPNELNAALTQMFHTPKYYQNYVFRFAQDTFPILRLLPMPGRKLVQAAREKMFGISRQLLDESKAFLEAKGLGTDSSRDLLTILVKANLGLGVPENQRLTDSDVMSQIPTFIVVGHETTSIALAWELYALAAHPDIQRKLRAELLGVATETPTLDQLHALPYLDSVVREALRLHSPVTYSGRQAVKDDVLPLSKPYTDRQNRVFHALPIQKGQNIHIPVLAVNTDKGLWGEDADEFRPERWAHTPEAVDSIPGVWANIMTFWAGPHGCIGYRFSLAEQKAMLFMLIRAFELEMAVPAGDVSRTSALSLARPFVVSEKEKGTQLPLIVKPFHPS
ncbi:cytochrome P450 [Mycena polygramma]|nr:cytochrome P450 [Mycena polygramma]